jgi:hypothetical protein
MDAEPFIGRVLSDESLTRGLEDPEARLLVEWLIERIETLALIDDEDEVIRSHCEYVYRRSRTVRRFIALWCHERQPGAAVQLLAAERLDWPLPSTDFRDPCEILWPILEWEELRLPTLSSDYCMSTE